MTHTFSASIALAALALASLALACSGSSTTIGTSSNDGGAAEQPDDPNAGDAPASKTPSSKVAQLCAGLCGDQAKCRSDEASICYAALSNDAKLSQLEACGAAGKCGADACAIATTASKQYVTACRDKVAACGGSIDGVSAGDCDDVVPVFRDEVIAAMKACLSRACGDVTACWKDAVEDAEPAACAAR